MPRRHIACLFVAILFLGNLAHGQIGSAALSSSDLVQMAIERNREFLAAKQRIAETRGLLRQAGVRPSPTVEVQEAIGPGEEQFSVGYFHTLETFGKRAKRTFVAKKSAELAEVEVADRIRQLTFEVKVRHAEAVAEQRKRRTINRLLGLNREYYRVTEARVEQGDAAPLEQQLLLTDLNRMEAQQLVLAARGERALLELRKIVGLAASEPLALPEDLAPAAVEVFLAHLLEQAAQNRPDLRLLQLLEEQVMAEVDLARAEAKPDITTSIRYSRSKTSFDQFGFNRAGQLVPLRDRDHVVAFGLSVPIRTAKRNQGAIEAALARATAARLRREHLQLAIRLEVEAAFRRWSAAKGALEILRAGVVEQSEKNLVVIREAYRLGQLRVLDVLNEQRRLVDTQLAYVDAQSELFQSLAELERAVGGAIR